MNKTLPHPVQDRIIWVDCEMTGLDKVNDALIEVAVLVTDANLNILGDGVDVVIKPPQGAIEKMDEFVTNMHTTSGLLAELESGIEMAEAERICLDYVKEFCEPGKSPLAGNSVGTDRAFIDRDLPEFANFLSYRTIDVSSFKEVAKRWFPRVFFNAPKKHGGHRALADIKESILELAYYREALIVADPGPSSEDLAKIATKYELKSE